MSKNAIGHTENYVVLESFLGFNAVRHFFVYRSQGLRG
jgi:hypothetical protein